MPRTKTVSDQVWLPPPADCKLAADTIHVWRADLDLPAQRVDELRSTLSADELRRAARFYFQKDRQRFIVGRGLLRTMLSYYLCVAPQQVHFDYTAYGKPALRPLSYQPILSFNIAHSDTLALYAFTYDRAVGIDLEHIRHNIEYEEIAAAFFSPAENTVLRSLPVERRSTAFFSCWTRKEAYIKAHGEGLSLPLDQFEVSLAPGEPVMLLRTLWFPDETARWSLHELRPGPGYVGALAVEGHGLHIACWQWLEPSRSQSC